jgi:hypothetical protein
LRRAVLLTLLAGCSCAVSAAPSPSPTPAPHAPTPAPSASGSPSALAHASTTAKETPDEWTQASRVFEQLSPDQKTKFLENLDQWKAMSPEEQELFRDRELFRRQKIASEIQDALGKSGLHLDDDQREVYVLRYTQERRKIEEELRKETDHKRQLMVADMLARLKVEFSGTPVPAPSAQP